MAKEEQVQGWNDRRGIDRSRPGGVLFAAALLVLAAEPSALTKSGGLEFGCSPGLTRSQAMQVVSNMVITGSGHEGELVAFSHPTALPAGTLVEPYLNEGGGAMTVGTCSWFFYLDLTPELRFEHDTKFVLVSGSFGSPSIVTMDRDWWPVLDGVPVYEDPALNALSPDLFFGSYPGLDVSCTLPSPPPVPAAPNPNLWGITFLGPGVYVKDRTVAADALEDSGGVAAGNIKPWSFDAGSIQAAVQEANNAGASCVYIYISTHGTRTNKLSSRVGGEMFTPAQLADLLDALRACSVIVVIDACFSGAFAGPILAALANRPLPLIPHPTGRIAVLTSASSTKECKQHSGNCAGSYWTQALAGCWADPAADMFGDGSVDVFEAYDWVLASGCDKAKAGDPQLAALTLLCSEVPAPVPALSDWGLIAMAGILACTGVLLIRRRIATRAIAARMEP